MLVLLQVTSKRNEPVLLGWGCWWEAQSGELNGVILRLLEALRGFEK